MQIKKIDVINRAAEEIRISGLTTTATPEEISSFLNRLDEMMSTLKNDGLDCGYIFPFSYGESDPNDDSGLELWMIQPISVLLSSDIASTYGSEKMALINPMKVRDARDSLSNGLVEIEGSKYPTTLPIGQANQYLGSDPYYYFGHEPKE
jgi:hypothetical protein